jgi:class 3 adenylate cyclase/tetratricopeptide (TPR) repeat protein
VADGNIAADRHAPGEAERRRLTVMFFDLVGSTELSRKLDPEDYRALITSFQEACSAAVGRFDGHVAKYLGDGVLVYFGYPRAHEDDAERAVRAGLDGVAAVRALDGGAGLHARVGIASGLVVVGDVAGESVSEAGAISGDTPNLAARLQAIAEPDGVVIGERTQALLGDVFECEDLGPQQLKGIEAPFRAWKVVAERRSESRFEAFHSGSLTNFVGREAELEMLRLRWRQAKSGEGQVVLISGEAGIGKSHLAQAFRNSLAGEAHTRLRYQCSPHHLLSAFYPIIAQLELGAGFSMADAASVRLDKLETLLARGSVDWETNVPLLADLLSIPFEERYAPLDLSRQRQKELTFEALCGQLTGLAEAEPVLMIFEDTHWIDPTSDEVLEHFVARVESARVLAVVTARPEYRPDWLDQAQVTALPLNRLGRRQCSALVRDVAGAAELSETVVEDILAKTDGIPLFVEEMTKNIVESGAASSMPETSAVPSTLQASLLARLDRLGSAKDVAQVGAVIGREFGYGLISAISPAGEDELNRHLGQLVESGLVLARGAAPESVYSFKHALVQDAAYESLLKSRRRSLHETIAQALEDQFSTVREAQPELLAHHHQGAGHSETAIGYWQEASRAALTRSAEIEAERCLQSAIKLIGAFETSPAMERRELELQLTLGAVLFAVRGMATDAPLPVYRRALELAERVGTPRDQVHALVGYGVGHWNTMAKAEPILRRALELAESSDLPDEAVYCRAYLGICVYLMGRSEESLEIREKGFSAYRPESVHRNHIDDPGVLLDGFRAVDLTILGYGDRALRIKHAAIEAGRVNPHAYTRCFAYIISSVFHCYRREGELALDDARAVMTIANEHAFGFWIHHGALYEAWALTIQGRGAERIDAIRDNIQALRHKKMDLARHLLSTAFAEALMQVNKPDEAIEAVDEGLEIIRITDCRIWQPELLRFRARALQASGAEALEVEAVLQRAIEIAEMQSARMLHIRAATDLARLWRDQGEAAKACDLLAPLFGWFTEGFDTPDLKDAKLLLDELS